MKVSICHQQLESEASPDELDVLQQVSAVQAALESLGAQVAVLPCGLDLDEVRAELQAQQPELVFNLVESLADQGALIHLVPSLLDALDVPYTGASAAALFTTSNKLVARRCGLAAGLPLAREYASGASGEFIVKSVWEHASRGLDAGSVVSAERVQAELAARRERFGGSFFAEEYVDGREFNVALLQQDRAAADEPRAEVLPIAEITFDGFDPGRPKIVDYAAKWETASLEYQRTQRRFARAAVDAELCDVLHRVALDCWSCFELDGYARVDFRVAGDRVVILEVNANPCLSLDAGFAAALHEAGHSFESAVERIVDAALRRSDSRRAPGANRSALGSHPNATLPYS